MSLKRTIKSLIKDLEEKCLLISNEISAFSPSVIEQAEENKDDATLNRYSDLLGVLNSLQQAHQHAEDIWQNL